MDHKHILGSSNQNDIRIANELPVVLQGMLKPFRPGERNGVPSIHRNHEFTYLRKGSAVFNIGGRSYQMNEGQTFVIKPNVTHTYQIDNKDAELAVVYFDFASRSKLEKAHDLKSQDKGSLFSVQSIGAFPSTDVGGRRPVNPIIPADERPLDSFLSFVSEDGLGDASSEPVVILHGRDSETIANVCERILYEEHNGGLAKGLMMQALALELLVVFSRALHDQWEESLRVQSGKAQELVEIAKDYIDYNYTKNISVSDIAGHVFLSTGYFARAFREVMDISPMNYLVRLRVDKACELLTKDDLKISAIASQVGFSSPQRFNAAFRKLMHMTPMEYRKEQTDASSSDN